MPAYEFEGVVPVVDPTAFECPPAVPLAVALVEHRLIRGGVS
jgi:hypothetical protein